MTAEKKYTPGPWAFAEVKFRKAVVAGGKNHIATIDGEELGPTWEDDNGDRWNSQMSHNRVLANARLIAAAPELLEAAEYAENILSETEPHSAMLKYLRAAIAKAHGQ